MPQNEHKKVLKELTEAYDAVYSEGLPGVTKPKTFPYALSPAYEEYPEESLFDKYKKAYETWMSDMREYQDTGPFNPIGPVYEQDLVIDGRLIGKKGQPQMPTAEEFGIQEHEAEMVRKELRR